MWAVFTFLFITVEFLLVYYLLWAISRLQIKEVRVNMASRAILGDVKDFVVQLFNKDGVQVNVPVGSTLTLVSNDEAVATVVVLSNDGREFACQATSHAVGDVTVQAVLHQDGLADISGVGTLTITEDTVVFSLVVGL